MNKNETLCMNALESLLEFKVFMHAGRSCTEKCDRAKRMEVDKRCDS